MKALTVFAHAIVRYFFWAFVCLVVAVEVTLIVNNWGMICEVLSPPPVEVSRIQTFGPTVAYAATDVGCQGEDWCIELADVAIKINNEKEARVEHLRRMGDEPGAPDMTPAIKYVLEHPKEDLYLAWIRPVPNMRTVVASWNIGLQLKSGGVVWAKKWIYQEGGTMVLSDPASYFQLVSGINGTSLSGNSFVPLLSFPDRDSNGELWKHGDVVGLAVE